jgi:methionine-rich copper-binding protein CopC
LTLRNGNRVVRFKAEAPFAVNNYNFVYLTNGLRDAQNTPFAGTNFYFYTGAAGDTGTPAVTSIAPPDGATDIGINATMRLYFSEGVNPLTVTAGAVSLSSDAGQIPIGVTFNTANTLVTVVPQAPLPASTLMTLTIVGLEDTAGNPIPPQTVQFTTGLNADTVPPSVVGTNITAYGVTNVPTNVVFQVTFDEPMDAATVLSQTEMFLYDYITGYKPGTGSLSADGRTFTFVPSGPMAVNRNHSINFSLGYDLSGNQQFAYSLVFTTTFASDTAAPTVTAVNPAAGATAVARNARVEIRFSEPVSSLSLGNVRLLSGGTTPVSITRTLSDNNRVLTLRPSTLLAQNRAYTISVAGVRDTSGNTMAGTFTSTFSTGSRTDLVPPTVTGTSPQYEDHGVGVNMVARVTFSEPIDPLLITADTFRMANPLSGTYIAATVAIATDRRSATLTPTAALLPYTQYYFTLSNIADVAGNVGGGTTIYFYTGAGPDTTPPVVSAISPPNGVPALPVNTKITVLMSEAIDATSVSNASIQLTPAAPGTVTLSSDRQTLTFTPSANLSTSTAYSILITGLRDTSANTMAAATFNFTTAASATADTTAPAIVGRTPTNNSAGVGVTSLLTFTTSERINAPAVGPSSVPVFATLPAGAGTFQLAGQYSVDSTGTVITFAVTGAFPANATITWYTNYNSTIRDMAGLLLPSQVAQFTTANVPDTTAPSVQSVTPSNGATGVGQYATVTLTFSESVNPNTINGNTVVLFGGATRLSASIIHSADNRMVFLSRALPLDETITVFATSGITDMSGNPLQPLTATFRTAAEFDATRPHVVTQRPSGSAVAVTAPITLFLNDPVDPATVQGALYVSQNGVLIDGTTTVGWSNRAITFTPATPFAPQATIEFRLTDDARDAAGNAVISYYGTFVTAADTASTTPTLVRTNPPVFSTENPMNVVLDLEFSEPLDPASLSAANVFVRDAASQPVAGALSMRNGNRVVRFTPAANFAPSNYNYFYYSGLTDLQGASITGSSFYFYTGAAADSSTPTVTFVNPPAAATGVGVNSPVRVTFSEPVNPTTLNTNTLVLAAGTTLAATLAIASDNRTVTITPQLPLPPSTQVTLTITGVEDVAGHVVATSASTFTTGNAPDLTPPTLVATSINYGDPSVPVNSIFQWTYNEAIDVSTILGQTNVLYDYTVGYVAGGTLSVSPDARTVTYVPPSTLVAGRNYSVNASGVTDLAGNVGGTVSIFFTTASASDLTPPDVVVTNPSPGATGVPLNARVRIAFDEPISATSLTNINVLVSGLPLPIASRTLSGGDRVVTLALTGLLAPDTVHTISVNVTDRAGNAMPAPETTTFTTGSGVDLLNLATTVTPSPAGGSTGVPVNVAPSITFSDAIDPTTVIYGGSSAVVLVVSATGQIVPVTYSFSADRRTVTMTPLSPLSAGTQYRMQASSATTDVAGNTFPTTVSFVFTTQP